MNLHKKAAIIFTVTFFFMITVMFMSTYLILSNTLLQVEETDAIEHVETSFSLLQKNVNAFSYNVTYLSSLPAFLSRDNESDSYVFSLLSDEMLSDQNVDILLFYNPSGDLVTSRHRGDRNNDNQSAAMLIEYIGDNDNVLLNHSDFTDSSSGFIFLEDFSVIVASRPVLDPLKRNTEIGTVIGCSFLDEAELESLSFLTSSYISFGSSDDFPYLIPDLRNASPSPVYGERILIRTIDKDSMMGYVELRDIAGNPGKILKIQIPRPINDLINNSMLYILILYLVVGLFWGNFNKFVSEKLLFSRVSSLKSNIDMIGEKGDHSLRVAIDGDDEIFSLSEHINRMLASLQENERKYQSLFERSSDAILLFDSKGHVLDVNSRASELLGYDKASLSELDLFSLIIEETISRGSYSSETKLEIANRVVIDADISSSVVDAVEGTVQIIVRDVSEKKRSEEALLNAKLAAEIASRTKSEFIAIMSHELRTPLTSIIGFSDIMLDGVAGDLTEKQDAYLKNISASGKDLLDIINNILDISKIESEGVELDFEIFSVPAVLEEIENVIMPLITKKSLTLEVYHDSKLSIINADRLVFKQTVYNLISNAIKFTPEGGKIVINTELCGDMAKFSVKDSGPGIAKEDYENVFQAFKQLDSSHDRFYGGTGIGLFLVKKFVEMHGGRVWLESELGNGSNFYFEIPISGEHFND